MEKIIEGLNSAQREAVLHGSGELLIVAGAGTGKTTVLTRRVAHLIASKAAKPSEILALTFTEKAASEMESRVDKLVPYGFVDVRISTFHAFGDRILREYALELGLNPDFKVLTQGEAAVFLRQHLFDLPLSELRPLGNPSKYVEALLGVVGRAKDEDISAGEYRSYADRLLSGRPEETRADRRQMEIALAYERYEELKAQEGLMDFGDQVVLALKLLRGHPDVLGKVSGRFKFILVDEFQDINHSQFELVRILSEAAGGNLTVVADDDQAIYAFRGACLSNILNFMNFYPRAKVVSLTRNYRSTQKILDSAYRLIRHNDPHRLEVTQNISKRLSGVGEGDVPVRVFGFEIPDEEVDFVAKRIREEVEKKKRAFSDFAVLLRSNKEARPFMSALNYFQIPWRFSADTHLLASPEIRYLLSFLKVLADPYDSACLHHIATSHFYGITLWDLAPFTHESRKSHRPLFEVLSRPDKYMSLWQELGDESVKNLKSLVRDVKRYMDMASKEPTGNVLYRFLDDHKVLSQIAQSNAWEDVARARNLARLFGLLKRFREAGIADHPRAFIENLEVLLEGESAPEFDTSDDRVQILTVHKAKGLEFPVVFLAGLTEENFPARRQGEVLEIPLELVKSGKSGDTILNSGEKPSRELSIVSPEIHIAEERRLFYVGMTRAKEELVLTWSKGGRKRARKPSRFILEALEVLKESLVLEPSGALLSPSSCAEPQGAAYGQAAPAGNALVDAEGEIHLSAYAVDDYLTCPLKYKLVHLLRIPVQRHHAVIYGAAVHEAVKAFCLARKEGRKISLDDMVAVFERRMSSEGFLSREHEERRMEKGRQVLARFHRENSGLPPPKSVEEEFRFYIDKNRVAGRFDRIDERNGETVIVDYKSSEVNDQKEADKKTRESLQMAVYALGFESKYCRPPEALELQFLDSGITGHVNPTPRMIDGAKRKIAEAAAGIRSQNFRAKPSYFTCSFCAYQWICPDARR